MSGNSYRGLYMPQITEALKEIAAKHSQDFHEIRALIDDLVAENALHVTIEYYQRKAKKSRDVLVAFRSRGDEEWATLTGTQWDDGCVALNRFVAAGPIFFNDVGCLLLDFKRHYPGADEVVFIYLDTGERRA